ncbi:uncharacterized protein LOC135482899 [Lineus longissimus]|uniref:uncharacterized protein LOC135482899 n=1 Tax=Lineus longissimus TaxID=88925 RepID=UPI00315D9CCB
METTGEDIDLENKTQLFSALQDNTHIVGHYFDLRTKSYFDKVMGPVFGVNTYWYRQEFAKSRGMIHWHGLCWREDREPHNLMYEAIQKGLSSEECANDLSNWAKSNCSLTGCHPATKMLMDVCESKATLLDDHLQLTNRINMHMCSDYCLRHVRGKKVRVCRMGFGTEEEPGRELRDVPAIVLDHNRNKRLEMERDHPSMVQHSRLHIQAWRANGDLSIIVSESQPENPSINEIIATEKYVSGYACKGNEPTGAVADIFKDMVNSADSAITDAKSLCSKLLMKTVKRDVSAMEASYELTSLPLYRCSHQFQSISISGFRTQERSVSTLTKNTPLDKYLARDKQDNASFYNFMCRGGRVPVINGSNTRASWPMNEDYCRTMLVLHWPNWRRLEDIKENRTSRTDKMTRFLTMDECPNFLRADIESARRHDNQNQQKDKDEPSDSEDTQPNSQLQPEWIDLVQPNKDFEDEVHDFIYDDGGPDRDWSSTSLQYPLSLGVNWLDRLQSLKPNIESLEIPKVDLHTMNVEQQFAFNIAMQTLMDYKDDPTSFTTPLRLVVTGTAGSGKAYLIKCLVKAIRLLFNNNKSVQVVCPTGNSANLISGVTLHSFF